MREAREIFDHPPSLNVRVKVYDELESAFLKVANGAFSTFQPNFIVRSLHSRLLSLLLIITNGVE